MKEIPKYGSESGRNMSDVLKGGTGVTDARWQGDGHI